jgi:hypothetical protein
MAWRTAGRLGSGGGPLILYFPPRLCETAMLEECVSDHGHEGMTMEALPGLFFENDRARVLLSTADGPVRKSIAL